MTTYASTHAYGADTTQWFAFRTFFDDFDRDRPEGYTARHTDTRPERRDLFSVTVLAVIVVALLGYGWVGLILAGLSVSLVALPATSLTIAGVLLAAGIFTLAERKRVSG